MAIGMTLFHGTDNEVAHKILESGFIVKENRKHWLGNGIYFFVDKSLAKWWTTRPSEKFGCEIKLPAIIECTYEYNAERILDLRNYDDYLICIEFFDIFCEFYRRYRRLEEIGFTKLRCTFFDWLFDIKDYDAIIGTFNSSDQPYLVPKIHEKSYFKNLNLEYTEVQVCIPVEKQNLLTNMCCKRIQSVVSQRVRVEG